MSSDIEAVIRTPNEALEACPFCGGRVVVVSTAWDWGPYDLRHVKFRCTDCGGLFEYAWRSDPWKRVPHAIEWFNTRTPKPPRTCCGYDTEQLAALAELLRESEITPGLLDQLCHNVAACVELAERRFARDLDRQLQEILAKPPSMPQVKEMEG
jgi:hypothetical protein